MWKDIKGYEGSYQISNDGKVRSLSRKAYDGKIVPSKILKTTLSGRGYQTVCLRRDNKTTRVYIHRLVAEHFVPNPNLLTMVNHIDGDKLNNHSDNLEWVTVSQNNQHAYDAGLKAKGEGFYNAKLTLEEVKEIRDRGKYTTFQNIADKYNVSKATIRDVLLNKTWN